MLSGKFVRWKNNLSNPTATRAFVSLFAPPTAKTIEELMKEQKELDAEAAEEGKAPGVPQPHSSMYDSTFAQVRTILQHLTRARFTI